MAQTSSPNGKLVVCPDALIGSTEAVAECEMLIEDKKALGSFKVPARRNLSFLSDRVMELRLGRPCEWPMQDYSSF
jgi:hypothetical protein